jgi:hypothetical protein
MPILGSIIKSAIDIRSRIPSRTSAMKQQLRQLRKLLTRAEFTAFGRQFGFSEMLLQPDPVKMFKQRVPIYDYESIFDAWWHRALKGERDVCWPGKINYFALSSGTSESSSKHIPVTREMIKTIHKGTLKQILSTRHFHLKPNQYETQILVVGGSSNLNYNGTYYSGDLSGITTGTQPRWFMNFTKPGPAITSLATWESKLQEIVEKAKDWNIGFICGVPAWIQIIFERIIKRYNVNTIHDVWPNLTIYVHGGVAIHPYKKSIDALCGKPLIYVDTYMASEGFLAYQERPNEQQALKLMTDNMLFFEFVPFTDENFDSDGNIKPGASSITLADTVLDQDYAVLITNCAGAWRYLIGDTIRVTDLSRSEVVITGRTKQYLSLCGEHLSVDNMNRAIRLTANELGIVTNEYCVVGIPYQGLFAHEWYIGTDRPLDEAAVREKLDSHLKILNDDYTVERRHALKEVIVHLLPNQAFIDFLASKNKLGGQSKFPRVLKGKQLNEWLAFLKHFNRNA